ncbi:uncharacterized protein LOC110694825 isoform X2 [Chenopodium quinoa]|uniref:uncharacterized protein LOC110694825 isoform X2 n=1 Tax=Chenopodium quinoa TaxID=63459 RepID=UPI000B796A47|nr:uncharacterized protein LOC110694825 isoform X2 [Chenopodium quinoa]
MVGVEKACPCGLGSCLVLTANTERNRGRKFFGCPNRQISMLYVMGVRAQIPYCRRKIDSSSSDVNRNRENRFINDGFRRELAGLTI